MVTLLSEATLDDLVFWGHNIVKLNNFSISPTTPSITTCKLVVRMLDGEGLYAASFLDKNKTLFSRQMSASKRNESSTYRECLVILDIYMNSNRPIFSFKGQQIMHLTDNKDVVAVFMKGSPKKKL